MPLRRYSPFDELLIRLDQGVRTVFGKPSGTKRRDPAEGVPDADLSATEKGIAAGLMRVNHAGEVCAQALYQGQALTAQQAEIREKLEQAAREENDHLAWCENRTQQLGGRVSYLNPLWYTGAFAVGAAAGMVGDKWNLGFLAETERQVVNHLEGHLTRLPENDAKSRAIIAQMRDDEARHASTALQAGAAQLPESVKAIMKIAARVMTRTTYWV